MCWRPPPSLMIRFAEKRRRLIEQTQAATPEAVSPCLVEHRFESDLPAHSAGNLKTVLTVARARRLGRRLLQATDTGRVRQRRLSLITAGQRGTDVWDLRRWACRQLHTHHLISHLI